MCVFAIACAFKCGVALVGKFIYSALLTPLWQNIFKHLRYIGGWNASKTLVVRKNPDLALFCIFKISGGKPSLGYVKRTEV